MNSSNSHELSAPKMWIDHIDLPTYQAGEANKNPLFLEKRVYQGSSGKIYPLAFIDSISKTKVLKRYEVIYLENDYIKVMIMPEMGGKIYRAIDKTNDYDFVYYNQVVKPALVGLAGPWVSGGIEFNWPQHHRPSTFSPVEYSMETNDDGSLTCWISEIDRMYGTKGRAGFTLHRDKAYIEIKGQLYNRTDIPQTFLWWANPAVAVNDHTKSIFPPDVHAVFDHGKRDVSKFPIATGTYYKMDYSEGVDISRYKNIPVPTSYMAYHSDYNFVGGYDFSVNAGILHIANHHISPGKKQWTWGNGDFGQAWDRNLTDEDGPYIELMTGIFTDNQPDFTWLAPKEGKTFTQYFMPYKSVGEVKNASLDGLINLEIMETTATFTLYVPSPQSNIQIILLEDERVIYRETLETLTPIKAYSKGINLSNTQTPDHYKLLILDADNYELISYQEAKKEILETPDPARAPLPPKDMPSCEELYLTGQHIEQYRHATYQADDYYLEAIKRDPNDLRNNNAYGLLLYRRGHFESAAKHFRTAIARATKRNPNPYDSEPFYNLGITLKKLNQLEDAYAALYKSTWNGQWQNAGFYELATIDVIRGQYTLALEHVSKSIVRNNHDIKARGLKSALLRLLDRTTDAITFTEETLKIDSTSFAGLYELYKLGSTERSTFTTLLRNHHQNYIELALDYGMSGLYVDAIEILSIYIEERETETIYPMVHYLKGYFHSMLEQNQEARAHYTMAENASSDYCFPHRLEEQLILEAAIKHNPEDSKALYYLGNLYYDKKRYNEAMDLWHQSIQIDASFPTALRNLALAYVNKKENLDQGLKYLELAFEANTSDSRVFFELDQLYKKLNYDFEQRLTLMRPHMKLVKERDDLFVEYLALLNNTGVYEEAKEAINNRSFSPWEGGEGKVTAQYKRCRIELAKKHLLTSNYTDAIKLLEECKVYPPNLGEGKLTNTAENDIDYLLGLAYEKLGNNPSAKVHYKLASVGIDQPTDAMFYNDQPADMMFYQGLAYARLGNPSKSLSEFNRMFDFGEKHIHDQVTIDYFAVSLPDFLVFDEDLTLNNTLHCKYLMALGLIGQSNFELGQTYLEECHKLNLSHQGVYFHLSIRDLLLI